MKLLKQFLLLTSLLTIMLAFNACEEDTLEPSKDVPSAPINLMATSFDNTTVHLMWEDASDILASELKDYTVTYYPANTNSDNAPEMTAMKSGEAFPISGLDSNKAYTFEVVTNYDNGESSTAAMITWAPANRFEKVDANAIKVYISDSDNGSGLLLYDEFLLATLEPSVLTVKQYGNWDLGLDTKVSGKVTFGSANMLSYADADQADASVKFADKYVFANGLNGAFNSTDLTEAKLGVTYSYSTFDLMAINPGDKEGVVFYIAKDGDSSLDPTMTNYGKVFVKYNKAESSFLFGTGKNQYIEVSVSYQVNVGLPYAKK